jgi:hypothetical protein
METTMTAVEITGIVDENHQLKLDAPLPITGPIPVRVIVLYAPGEIDENLWLQAAASNPAFEFLNDPKEDIYTLADGKPVQE